MRLPHKFPVWRAVWLALSLAPTLSAAVGDIRWVYTAAGGVYSSPALGADGTVYVGSRSDATLHAIDSNGELKWRFFAGLAIALRLPSEYCYVYRESHNKLYS
jgi:outer membrane protein assembly factor BamB